MLPLFFRNMIQLVINLPPFRIFFLTLTRISDIILSLKQNAAEYMAEFPGEYGQECKMVFQNRIE